VHKDLWFLSILPDTVIGKNKGPIPTEKTSINNAASDDVSYCNLALSLPNSSQINDKFWQRGSNRNSGKSVPSDTVSRSIMRGETPNAEAIFTECSTAFWAEKASRAISKIKSVIPIVKS
jgi:hypothetical protein